MLFSSLVNYEVTAYEATQIVSRRLSFPCGISCVSIIH